ncbi:MAG: hypothetical protein IJW62_09195 [Clostridia bacterium]|nr:hypothetical protein [Clostridia bacterium]
MDNNFDIEVIPGTLTITTKSITAADVELNGSLTYNGSEQTQNITVTNGITYTVSGNTATNAGTYTLTVTGNGNYTGTVEVEWTIAKKAATITADNVTIVAGNGAPTLSATVIGNVTGEPLNYTLSTDYVSAIGNHGTYDIVVTLGDNPNYNVSVVDGTLTVEQCVLTVDGVAFNSWADARSSIKKDSQIKLYADVEYGVDENGKKVEHKFPTNGGSIVIDLNGFDLTFHHTATVQFGTVLTVTDTSNGVPGTLKNTNGSYPLAINAKSTVNLVNGVGFDGTMQFQGLSNGSAYFQINGENIIGTDNSLFVCDTTTVRLTLKDQYMTLGLLMGHLTLTQNLETLALQEITIASGTGITIPAGVTLTLNPTTNVTIKGTVDGEGTIKVGTKTHLDQVLTETAITNIAIAEGIVIDSYTLDRADINYTGAINLIDTGVVITAGTFDADVYANCADGYWAKNNGDGTWTVLKKIEIGSVVIGDKLTYNGTAQNPTNITVYDVNGNVVASENYNVIVTSQTDAGTYVLTVKAKDGNYGFFGSAEANWTIAKKAATITANDKTMVAGNTIPTLDATVEGVVDGKTLNYTLSTDYVSAIGNVGTYAIVVTLGDNPNYDVTVVDGTLTVLECVLTVNDTAFNSWADAKATIDANTGWNKTCEIVLYADVDSDNNGFNPNGSITVDLNGNTWTSHWMGISYNTVVNVINSSDKTGNVLVTRSDNRVVLGANSVFNLNGNIAFDGTIQLNNGAQNTTGYFQINGENIIGEKDSLFVDSGNSTVRVIMKDSFMSINLIYGRLTLTEDLATLTGQEIILASGTSITIPENVELTLDADTVLTIKGIVDGEGTVVVNSFEHLQQVLSETTVANIKLGSDINVIARALETATVEAGRTVTLDLNGKTLNAELAVNGNLTIVDSTVTGTTAQDYMAAGSVLGDVTVNGTLVLNAGNYSKDMDTYCASGLVTIKTAEGVYTVMPPQEFSATLNNETHIYNGNVQTQGFVATDAFGNTLVEGTDFTVTGNTATTAGSHTITIKGTGDYTGTVTLEWTIAKATVTVTVNSVTITYGEKTPAVTLTYSDELAKTEVIYNLSWNAPEYANVGTYTINIVYQTFPNWNVTLLGGSLTVIPKDVTITADNKSMVAGNTVPELTATVVGAVDGETLNYTLSVDTDGKTVGTFDIVVTLGENPNYNVTVVNGTLTVETAIARNTNTGVNYAKLADAIAEVKSGETIVFLTDIDEDVTIKQAKNVQFTIDGANYKYFGTMTVNGTGYAGAQGQALTIKNINFVVDGYGLYINGSAKADRYARNITVEGCTFTGEGYDDYGMRLRYVYDVVVKNTTGNGMFDLVYGASSVTGFTAENVEVINSTNGIVLSYVNSTATFKNVNTSVTEAGVLIRNNAKGTVNFEECGIDSIVYYATDANTASVTMNFIDTTNNLVIDGASDKLTIVLNKVDTTVTAIDGLKATTTVDGYRVAYEDGKYFLVEIDYVAQIGDTKYESIQEAVDAAQDGDTIVILKDHVIGATVQTEANFGYESVIIVDGKNVTIDFAGHTVTVKHGDAANYADGIASCLEAVVFIYDNAGLTLMDSTGDNGGFYVPADENVAIYSMFYNCGGELTINSGAYNIEKGYKSASIIYAEDDHKSAVTGGNFTMGNAGENSDTKPWIFNTEGKNATFVYISGGTYNQNPYLNYGTQKDCEAKLVEGYCIKNNGDDTWTVLPHSYTAVVTAPTCTEGGYTTYTCDCGHSYVADYTEVIGHVGGTPIYVIESQVTCTTNGIMHVITSCTECGHEISRDTIVTPAKGHVAGAPVQENYVAPTVDAEGGYDMVTYCGVCGEELSSVHHTVAKLEPVAKNTATGKIYATLAAAIKAATAGDTIVLLANVTEDVTVSKDITIDGDNWQYTGNISVSGTATDATVKNVNFVNGTGYAITTNRITSITVENCTVKNYGYGFLYANKSTPTVVVKDVTVEDATLGINWVYGTTATLENVVMNNVPYGLQIHNYASKTINLKNCDITSIVIYERSGSSGMQTFKFYGDNTVDTLTGSQYAKYVLAEVDATLTAPADFAVASGVAGYEVAYENGKYFLTAIVYDYVAQNITTGVSYESLQEAIEAAKNGETIVLLKDIELTTAETIKNSGEYATIFNVADKAITIDLNGYDITVDASAADLADEKSSMLMGVFTVDTNGTLTLKDSVGTGSVEVSANDAIVYSLVTCYGNGGKLNIESGSYTADKVDSALIYSQYDEVIIVSGGNFHLGNVGTGDNGSPWIFNAKGQNTQNIIVIGGTFNADVFHQYYIFEVKDAVEVAELLGVPVKACKNNGDGTWTIVDAVAYVAEQHKSGNWYTQNVGYATFAEAYAAADEVEKITILANVTVDFDLTKNVVVYKGSNTVTFAEGAEVYAGTFDWNVNDDCAIGYYAKDNGDGTWTVEKRKDVAYNVNDDVYYTDVSDALMAATSGETVILLVDDQTEAMLMVPAGVTFNLNGHTITAGNVFSFGNVIDNNGETDGLGGIKISNDKTQAFTQLQQNNTYLPLYDAANGCYRFYAYTVGLLSLKTPLSNAVTFRFRLRLSSAEAYRLLADTANSGVELSVNVSWTGVTASNVKYVVTGEFLQEYAEGAYQQVVSGQKTAMTVNKTIEFSLSGLDALESGSVITATPTFTSTATGVVAERTDKVDGYTSYTYTAPAADAE